MLSISRHECKEWRRYLKTIGQRVRTPSGMSWSESVWTSREWDGEWKEERVEFFSWCQNERKTLYAPEFIRLNNSWLNVLVGKFRLRKENQMSTVDEKFVNEEVEKLLVPNWHKFEVMKKRSTWESFSFSFFKKKDKKVFGQKVFNFEKKIGFFLFDKRDFHLKEFFSVIVQKQKMMSAKNCAWIRTRSSSEIDNCMMTTQPEDHFSKYCDVTN